MITQLGGMRVRNSSVYQRYHFPIFELPSIIIISLNSIKLIRMTLMRVIKMLMQKVGNSRWRYIDRAIDKSFTKNKVISAIQSVLSMLIVSGSLFFGEL